VGDTDLESDYERAWDEWALSEDAALWDFATAAGLEGLPQD